MSNNMSIYNSIVAGLHIADNKSARVSESKVGVEMFAKWRACENLAYDAFYDYACAKRKSASMGENATIDKEVSDKAFAILRELLSCIGEVNGYKIVANADMMDEVCVCTRKRVKPLAGEALKQASIVKNLRDEVNGFANGMNPDYVQAKTLEYETAKAKLAVLKKQDDSCDNKDIRVSKTAFYTALEDTLAKIAMKQEMTPRAVLEAEAAKRKAERDAKRKANKQAKSAQK